MFSGFLPVLYLNSFYKCPLGYLAIFTSFCGFGGWTRTCVCVCVCVCVVDGHACVCVCVCVWWMDTHVCVCACVCVLIISWNPNSNIQLPTRLYLRVYNLSISKARLNINLHKFACNIFISNYPVWHHRVSNTRTSNLRLSSSSPSPYYLPPR